MFNFSWFIAGQTKITVTIIAWVAFMPKGCILVIHIYVYISLFSLPLSLSLSLYIYIYIHISLLHISTHYTLPSDLIKLNHLSVINIWWNDLFELVCFTDMSWFYFLSHFTQFFRIIKGMTSSTTITSHLYVLRHHHMAYLPQGFYWLANVFVSDWLLGVLIELLIPKDFGLVKLLLDTKGITR